MGKLPNLVTNALTGEAMNYNDGDYGKVEFKQTFEVTQNSNFTWTIKSALYVKLSSDYPQGKGERFENGIWQNIGDGKFRLTADVQILSSTGVWINGVQVSNNAYEYYKIMENVTTRECSETGRYFLLLRCGYIGSNSDYYFNDYTLIYLTLPAFSGMKYKKNNSYVLVMPWIKVNGEWKRALQYVKVNGEWKEYKDSWMYNPKV